MILLDTDHLTILRYPENPRYEQLTARMYESLDEHFTTTIVNVEEQTRGWLSYINARREILDQIEGYERLAELFEFFADWEIVRLDEQAAVEFRRLRQQGIRIGTMDLKIAAIALVQNATLLTANLGDFQKVPGLRVENWIE